MARARKTLRERGQEALERNNLEYALKLYWQYLANNPGDVEARQELRVAQIQRLKEKKPSALAKAVRSILSLPNQIVVQLDWQIRRKAKRICLVDVECEFVRIAVQQQGRFFIFDALAKLVDLHEVDQIEL